MTSSAVVQALRRPIRWSVLSPASWVEVVLVSAVTIFLGVWRDRFNPVRPRDGAPGFMDWWDQGQYLELTRILASGALPGPTEFTYGLGYPLLAVPTQLLGFTRDPFLAPDLLMAAITMVALYISGCRLVGRFGGLAAVALLLMVSPFVSMVITPWSSTVSTCAFAVAVMVATTPGFTHWRTVCLGALAGFVFATRYLDAVALAAVALWYALVPGRGHRFTALLAAMLPLVVFIGAVAVVQFVVFGSPFTTPYLSHVRGDGTSDQSIGQYRPAVIIPHFLETFITGAHNAFPDFASPLLVVSPFLLLLPVGALLVFRRRYSQRSFHAVLLATTGALSLVYLSFVAGGGADLAFYNYRYWLPFYPYWTLLCVLAARDVWQALEPKVNRRA